MPSYCHSIENIYTIETESNRIESLCIHCKKDKIDYLMARGKRVERMVNNNSD